MNFEMQLVCDTGPSRGFMTYGLRNGGLREWTAIATALQVSIELAMLDSVSLSFEVTHAQ